MFDSYYAVWKTTNYQFTVPIKYYSLEVALCPRPGKEASFFFFFHLSRNAAHNNSILIMMHFQFFPVSEVLIQLNGNYSGLFISLHVGLHHIIRDNKYLLCPHELTHESSDSVDTNMQQYMLYKERG